MPELLPSPLIAPVLRDDLPRYPQLLQLIRVTTSTVSGPAGSPPLHSSYTEQLKTDTLAPRDREACLAVDVNGGGLSAGYYLGRLAGSWTSLPVYEVVGALTSTSDYTGGTVIFNNTTVNYNTSPTTTNYNVSPVFNIASYQNLVYNGPGYYTINAPFEVCGYLFWCCTTHSFNTATVNNWALPGAAIVFDITPNSGGTTVTGIVPQAYGVPVNTGAVTNATNVSPIVLTVPGWTTQPPLGAAVKVTGINGNTAANGTWTVQAVTATTLTLKNTTGNGAFAASPNSTVQIAGPQLIVLNNVYASGNLILSNLSASSDDANQIILPPEYGSSLTMAAGDSVTLWWDYCTSYQWRVLSCTVTGSPLTTKGDIYGFSTVNARIPVGSNTEVLTADSTQALGVKWAAAGGGTTSTRGETQTGSSTTLSKLGYTNLTGGSVTLPSIGTYQLVATVHFVSGLIFSGGPIRAGGLAQLIDSTVGGNLSSPIGESHLTIATGDPQSVAASTTIVVQITTTQTNEVINVSAKYIDYDLGGATDPGMTATSCLDYFRLA